ncbi:MAG: hypothetical protein HY929_07920 [Euryarchaeota archaeon]|nr:hypothetical protein [Euryarchaeota archaeon]
MEEIIYEDNISPEVYRVLFIPIAIFYASIMLLLTVVNYYFSKILPNFMLVILWFFSLSFLAAYEFLLRTTKYLITQTGIVIKYPLVEPKIIPFLNIKNIKVEKIEEAYKPWHVKIFKLFIGTKHFLTKTAVVVDITDIKWSSLALNPNSILLTPSNPYKFAEIAQSYVLKKQLVQL